jgi:hypothetical protein
MNSIIFIIFIFFINVSFHPVFAATATESAAQNLLDRVATKVATLAEKLKRGAAGEITAISSKSISLGDQKIITSEATVYYRIKAGNRSVIDFKNLVKGDDIAAVGISDTSTGDLTARQIIAKIQRLVLAGKVTSIDKKNNLYTLNGKEAEIDAATTVKKATASGFLKAKYSDIAVGDNLIIYGYYNKPTDPLTALKALIISQ